MQKLNFRKRLTRLAIETRQDRAYFAAKRKKSAGKCREVKR